MHARWTVGAAALAAITLVLAACVSVPQGAAPSASRAAALARAGQPAAAARMYEALARASQGTERNDLALKAAQAYLVAKQPDDAARALEAVQPPLGPGQGFERSLLSVRITASRGQSAQAWQQISAIAAPIEPAQAASYFRLKERIAFAANRPAEAVQAEMQLEHWLLKAAAIEQSRVQLLYSLRAASERGVTIEPALAVNPVVRGWLELGPLAAEAARNPTAALTPLTAWLAQHPGHPAAGVVRSKLLGEQPQSLAAQAHIALLLPISGPAAAFGSDVRDGFLAAYYQTPVEQRPTVRVYDTGGGESVADLIAGAGQAGADFIVGPLLRPAVIGAAADSAQRPPILALNFLPEGEPAPPLFFQFALNPAEEARMVARRVLSDGEQLGIAVVPGNDWGTRVLGAFTQQLTSGGGTLLASTRIDLSQSDYSEELKQVLLIDESQARLTRLESVLGTRLVFVPRRRGDIQFIFAAVPYEAERLLLPQLRFYYAGGIPTYSTSDAFDPDPKSNRDLDGLMFPDMPWMLGDPVAEAVRAAASQAWPAGGPILGRLFAFGFDAYGIAEALRQNRTATALELNGLTGQLTLGPHGRIHRKLIWARLQGGEVQELPSPPGE
jgi:outer membrane PBP1 activator LpoA protein